jgi:hypothetical protein
MTSASKMAFMRSKISRGLEINSVFLFAFYSGVPITTGFIAAVGLLATHLAFPRLLGSPKRLDQIVVTGMVWVRRLIDVSA